MQRAGTTCCRRHRPRGNDYSIQDGTVNGERISSFWAVDCGQETRPDRAGRPRYLPPFQAGADYVGRTEPIAGVLLAKRAPEYNPDEQVWNESRTTASETAGEKQGGLKARLTSALDSLKQNTLRIISFSICRTPSMRRVSLNQLRTLYDRDSAVGRLDKALDEAPKKAGTV